jgi:hypothetical protein
MARGINVLGLLPALAVKQLPWITGSVSCVTTAMGALKHV